MNTATYIFYSALIVIAILTESGVSKSSISILLVALALGAIPWYFGTRDRSIEPSRSERILAATWVWFRRILGISTGILMLGASFYSVFSESGSREVPSHWHWLAAGFLLLLGLFFIYVGIFGQGTRRYDWRDDMKLHQENKRRYRWRI